MRTETQKLKHSKLNFTKKRDFCANVKVWDMKRFFSSPQNLKYFVSILY